MTGTWSHQEVVTAWVILGIWVVGCLVAAALAAWQERREGRRRKDEVARLYKRFGKEPPK